MHNIMALKGNIMRFFSAQSSHKTQNAFLECTPRFEPAVQLFSALSIFIV